LQEKVEKLESKNGNKAGSKGEALLKKKAEKKKKRQEKKKARINSYFVSFVKRSKKLISLILKLDKEGQKDYSKALACLKELIGKNN